MSSIIYPLSVNNMNNDSGPIDVSVIIPLFNKHELTRQCYESIKKHPLKDINYELIFVDNGSIDDTRQFLNSVKDKAKIIINKKNLGFAKACNQGAKAAAGRYILFLNNDVIVTNNWLNPLVDTLDNDPSVGAVGSKLLFPDGKIQHAGVIIIDDRKLPDPLVGRHIFYKHDSDFIEANKNFKYQALTAACLLVRKSAFDEAEGFDEGFWNGYEDVDLCFKLQKQNLILVYEPKSVLIHYESQSGPERFRQTANNIKRLHQKWIGKITPDIIIEKDGSYKKTRAGKTSPYFPIPSLKKQQDYSCENRPRPVVSIIILTYNQIDYTKRCIESIFKYTKTPFELILVDNGSTDKTVAFLESIAAVTKDDVAVKVILNNENIGFAAGNNKGLAAARGEYILLLNNDTVVTEGWLGRMIACADAHPHAGIFGPMSNYVSGPQLVGQVDYNTNTLEGLQRYAKRFSGKRRGRARRFFRVVGFCMLIRKSVIQKIGGLDDRFGKGNFEDDDFTIRAALAGFESWIVEDCFVHHFGSRTFKGARIDFKATLLKNWQVFKDKWGLPQDLPYGTGYNLSQLKMNRFDSSKHYIQLPGYTSDRDILQDEEHETRNEIPSNATISKILNKARLMAFKGQVDGSIKILFNGIRSSNRDLRFFCLLCEILINERQYNTALEVLNKFPSEGTELKRLEFKGCCEEALDRTPDANECADRILALGCDNAVAFFLKGKIAMKETQAGDAERFFSQAVIADETFGPAYTWLGLLKKAEGLKDEALDLLEKGFSLSPTNNETLTYYHKEARNQKVFKRAEDIFRKARETYPKHRLIQFQIIDLLLQQERFGEAMNEIESAILEFGFDDGLLAAAINVRRRLGPKEIESTSNRKATLSLCMIVKNEEKNIGKCLMNLKPISDEIIVVDTGSSDRTKALAEIFGAKVYDFEWNNDFSAARNCSLSQAVGDWILIMDADEAISPEDFAALKKIIKNINQKTRAFSFVTRNYHTRTNVIGLQTNDGRYKEEAGYGWTGSDKVRLFKNGLNIRFEYPVHEAVEPSLRQKKINIHKCSIPVHHYGKLNYSMDIKKGEEYFNLGIEKLEKSPDDTKAIFELAIQAGGLKKWEEAISLWQRYNRLSPNNPTAYANMGAAYIRLKKFDDAILSTKKAMDLDPTMVDATSNYALFHIFQGNAETSIPFLERLEKNSPDYLSARFKLASAYTCIDMNEDAIRIFEELKKTAIGPNLLTLCRNMMKELTIFGQSQYVNRMAAMTARIFTGSPVTQSI